MNEDLFYNHLTPVSSESELPAATQPTTAKSVEDQILEALTARGLKCKIIDMTQPPPRPEYLLKINDVGIMPKGALTGMVAKAKSGKTTASLLIAAAMLKGSVEGVLVRATATPPKILIFDTEQNEYTVYTRACWLMDMAGMERANHDGIMIASANQEPLEERLDILKVHLCIYKPDFVIVDGIRDLIKDINDQKESYDLMDDLRKLAIDHDCNILCVIHANPSGESSKARGHLGTELMNKCFNCFSVERNKDRGWFEVKDTLPRERETKPWAFQYNENGIPELVNAAAIKAAEKEDELRELIVSAFTALQSDKELCAVAIKQSALTAEVASQGHTSKPTAKRKILEAKQIGLIREDAEHAGSKAAMVRLAFVPSKTECPDGYCDDREEAEDEE